MFQLALERAFCQDAAESSPHVAPPGFPCLKCVGYQIIGVLRIGICETGDVDLRIVVPTALDASAVAAAVGDGAIIGAADDTARDHGVDVRRVVLVLLGDLPAQQNCQLFVCGLQRDRHDHGVGFLCDRDGTVIRFCHDSVCPLLLTKEAGHELSGFSATWRLLSKAEGIKNGLDLDGVKAAALLTEVVCVSYGSIQLCESLLHFRDVRPELCRDGLRIGCPIEAGFYCQVVVICSARRGRAEECGNQNER